MAKRKTKAMLESELATALEDLATTKGGYQTLASEVRALRRLGANLATQIGQLEKTIATKDSLAREMDAIMRNRDRRIAELANSLEDAQHNAQFWQGQYRNADARVTTTEKVAFLLAIPVAQTVTMTKAVEIMMINAKAVGIEMTDEVKMATRLAMANAADAVLENEMAHAEQYATTQGNKAMQTDQQFTFLSKIAKIVPADNK